MEGKNEMSIPPQEAGQKIKKKIRKVVIFVKEESIARMDMIAHIGSMKKVIRMKKKLNNKASII